MPIWRKRHCYDSTTGKDTPYRGHAPGLFSLLTYPEVKIEKTALNQARSLVVVLGPNLTQSQGQTLNLDQTIALGNLNLRRDIGQTQNIQAKERIRKRGRSTSRGRSRLAGYRFVALKKFILPKAFKWIILTLGSP